MKKAGPHAPVPGQPEAEPDDTEPEEQATLCNSCHLAYSDCWEEMDKVELTCQPRFSSDSDWAEFLNLIRQRPPTQAELDHYMSDAAGIRHVSKAAALARVSDHIRALCSHCEDVHKYNDAAVDGKCLPLLQTSCELLICFSSCPHLHFTLPCCFICTLNLCIHRPFSGGYPADVQELQEYPWAGAVAGPAQLPCPHQGGHRGHCGAHQQHLRAGGCRQRQHRDSPCTGVRATDGGRGW